MAGHPIIFGEVLFDSFPDGESVLGGAPFNVAWHLQGFGLHPRFLSCVGEDRLGETVKQKMHDWGMDMSLLQQVNDKPTGKVQISFVDTEPHYDIRADQAYDHIAFTPDLADALASDCDLFYYGSLAVRADNNAATLQSLLKASASHVRKLMDVNLRPPWWKSDQLSRLVKAADWVKLNQDELLQLNSSAQADPESSDSDELIGAARDYLEKNSLSGLIVTRGEHGALILHGDQLVRAQTHKVRNMVNPVGAGDAFTAVMILGFLRHWSLSDSLQRAQQFAAKICETKAAISEDKSLYQDLLQQWSQ